LRNDLRKDILEAVRSLRNYFVHIQSNLEAKTAAYEELAREAKDSKEEIRSIRDTERIRTRHTGSSLDRRLNGHSYTRQVLPPDGKSCKLYSEVAIMEGNAD
jgi:ribosome-binding protein aMBF1 (putative translation factor)